MYDLICRIDSKSQLGIVYARIDGEDIATAIIRALDFLMACVGFGSAYSRVLQCSRS